MEEIAIGRKEIMKALHISSWRTIIRKKKRTGFARLIRKEPISGKPMLIWSEYIAYIRAYNPK